MRLSRKPLKQTSEKEIEITMKYALIVSSDGSGVYQLVVDVDDAWRRFTA
jgi:hypothetical protein